MLDVEISRNYEFPFRHYLTGVRALIEEEGARLTALRNASTAAEVRAAFGGDSYSSDNKKD